MCYIDTRLISAALLQAAVALLSRFCVVAVALAQHTGIRLANIPFIGVIVTPRVATKAGVLVNHEIRVTAIITALGALTTITIRLLVWTYYRVTIAFLLPALAACSSWKCSLGAQMDTTVIANFSRVRKKRVFLPECQLHAT